MYEKREVNSSQKIESPEKRYLKVELRVEGDSKPRIHGYAAVFNQKSEDLGGFREYVKPGAFSDSILKDDIRALFNHDPNYVLGRNKNGTLKMEEDPLGLHFEVEPPDTSWARDLMAQIRRGDIDQCSFGFKTENDKWRTEDGEQVRDLEKCRLFDVSVVTQPAYPQTSVACRAMLESRLSSDTAPKGKSESEIAPKGNSEERRRIQKVLDENKLLEA